MKELGYANVVLEHKNKLFLDFLSSKNIQKDNLKIEEMGILWKELFDEELTSESIRKKFKLFTSEPLNFKIRFVSELPAINTFSTTILILSSFQRSFHDDWRFFQTVIQKSKIAPYKMTKNDFDLSVDIDHIGLLNLISEMDESHRKQNRQKKLYILFFLWITSQKKALLPTSFISSSDTFFYNITGIKALEYFHKKHFFMIMPLNEHLIHQELGNNHKAKYINYMRFSYLVNSTPKRLEEITDDHISRIMLNMRVSQKSEKMVGVNENSIRRCLYWHGAINISQTKREADRVDISPLEMLYSLKLSDEHLLNAFCRFFSGRPNNVENRKYAKHTVNLLQFLDEDLEEISRVTLKSFFLTSLKKKSDGSTQMDSNFLHYLQHSDLALSTQQDFQMIVFQAIESDNDLSGCFPKNCLVTLYRNPKNRTIARLAFDKKILERMKQICIFNPPSDKYYISASNNKHKKFWPHFRYAEPLLPVMLFTHLSMPWRKEHILSLDRDSFLVKDEKKYVIAWKITTDKNQNNDFYIEREFIDYVFKLDDLDGKPVDIMHLLDETIEYSKFCFPKLKPLLRKENTNWGEIKPILPGRNAKGFISDTVYSGYYYKVLLKALFELGYSTDEIQYFVQLSPSGQKRFGGFPANYDAIEALSPNKTNEFFNSEYFSPHALRKSNITLFVHERKSFEFILKLSGHTGLSTVLQVYIDYDLLAKLNISSMAKTAIIHHFGNDSTRVTAKRIIENYKKFHFIEIDEIKNKLAEENLFFSPVILSKDKKKIEKNTHETVKILKPAFWEDLSTGICTNALNCPIFMENHCSICPFFLTGPTFLSAINSKIMQLTTKAVEFFRIIEKHIVDEHLNNKEAEIYEEELQMVLAELHGYTNITKKLNEWLYEFILHQCTEDEKKNLPAPFDLVLLKYDHTPYYAAQLEIYKNAKSNMDSNISTQFATSELYKKIMELIVLGELPRDLFVEYLENQEKVIDIFIGLIHSNKDKAISDIANQFLLEHNTDEIRQ